MSAIETSRKTQVLILPAYHGDSIIVKTIDSNGNPFNMVIDGGTTKTYDDILRTELKALKFINVMVLTHIDSDHIAGLIKFLKNPLFNPSQVGTYWFNSKNIKFLRDSENISYAQAKTFEELLVDRGGIKDKWSEDIYVGVTPALPPGITVEILSPTFEVLRELYEKWPDLSAEYYKKLTDLNITSRVAPTQISRGGLVSLAALDDSPEKTITQDLFNSSSIAFVLRTFDLSIFLMGDSHPDLVKKTMCAKGYSVQNKLKVDIVKISHHGSKNNTIKDILDMLDCERYVISTNGGSSDHTHPDRETIARLIYHPERIRQEFANRRLIYLNYPKTVVEHRAGQFIAEEDLSAGNWALVENTNCFTYE